MIEFRWTVRAQEIGIKQKKITISKMPSDVSHVISQEIPIYPGNPIPKFKSVLNLKNDGVNVSRIRHAHRYSHRFSEPLYYGWHWN